MSDSVAKARDQSGPAPPGEILALTSLRGFLAAWVVLYHFWNDLVNLFPTLAVASPLAQLGHLAVPAFFMLSGYVLAYNYAAKFQQLRWQEYVRFLALRLARIYPVHLVTLLTVAAMLAVSQRLGYQLTDSGYSTRDFLLNLVLAQTWTPDFSLNWNYPSWSISSEWFAYLLFPPATVLILQRLSTRRQAWLLSGFSLLSAVLLMLFWQGKPFYELLLVIPTFFAGTGCHWILRGATVETPPRLGRWIPEALVIGIILAPFLFPAKLTVAMLLCSFLGIILALAWLRGSCQSIWLLSPSVYLGEVSYSLYMTHTLAQKVLYRLLPSGQHALADWSTRLLVLAAYGSLIVGCCLATYYLIEKPCRAYFKRRAKR